MDHVIVKIHDFIKLESAGGLALMATAALALIVANSPLASIYEEFLALPFSIQAGALNISNPLIL